MVRFLKGIEKRSKIMWLQVAAVVILGVTLAGNSLAEDRDEKSMKKAGHESHRQANIRPVQEMRQVRTPTVQEMHRAVTQQVQEIRQPVTTPVQEIRQPITTRVEKDRRINSTVIQEVRWVDKEGDRDNRQTVRTDNREEQHHRFSNDRRSSVSIYYPNYGYSYYGNPYASYPKIYFICYQEDQVQEDRIYISCPYPTAWYSTAPVYSSLQYQSNYRPEYICPRYGASQYIEFNTSYEANSWSYQNCNRWINYHNSQND
jgi:hypothetical protein